MTSDSAGRLGTHKGLHTDGNIREVLNQLTAMERCGYTVTTHSSRKISVTYPHGGTVDLVYAQGLGEWVAIERGEWGSSEPAGDQT